MRKKWRRGGSGQRRGTEKREQFGGAYTEKKEGWKKIWIERKGMNCKMS